MPLAPGQLEEIAARLNVAPSTARTYLRESVTLPDGRRITGQPPGCAGATVTEHWLRDDLARQLRGITEAVLPYGRADVLTTKAVFEVESARNWRAGMRQVLAYSVQCGLPPALALFGKAHRDEVLKLYLRLRDGKPYVDLWWHCGRWVHINSRRTCRNMPAPSEHLVTGTRRDRTAQTLRTAAATGRGTLAKDRNREGRRELRSSSERGAVRSCAPGGRRHSAWRRMRRADEDEQPPLSSPRAIVTTPGGRVTCCMVITLPPSAEASGFGRAHLGGR